MRLALACVVSILAFPSSIYAQAESTGAGSGRNAATPPVTKSAGPPREEAHLPARDLPLEPRHGMLGAPGSAVDGEGPSRLGSHSDRSTAPSYGEGGPAGPGWWRSGDRARSASSADVRAARREQAPDLEWAGGGS
ncbi:MAG TPA: hypothetical protein VLV17_01955 [Anaeromyxobacteraceae bacterium]|nr:hypothetical protein [Anaeromyxobacteraceae bacterium]